ncbi:sulfite exporter TauE/SafE family protein [Mesorhizobium sp. CAU 1732]|uniref:sulfite exporter TauE/SafE family protein n=1 Tax=Mesorhizobium sp. CAU 1732 TaxID=3140358 RepID=UPI00326033E0
MVGLDLPVSELVTFAVALAAASIVSGLMAGIFGIGGGAVLVPVFYQVFGLLDVEEAVRMHLSVGSSLAIIIPTAIRSFMAHRAKGAVDMDLLKKFLIPVPVGVVLASLTAAYISSEGLRVVFAVMTLLVAGRLLFNRDSWRIGSDIPKNPGVSIAGVFIGYFSTLMGIGGGVLNNTFMTVFGRPMHQAVATSSGVGVLIGIPGTIGYIWAGWGNPDLPIASTGYINWIAVALTIPLALLVTPYGVRIAHALTKRQLEISFGLFCIFVSARFFWSLID